MNLNSLTFKNRPIEIVDNHMGFGIIVVSFSPNVYECSRYFYYIRNQDLEIVADNSKGEGEESAQDALLKAKFIIEQSLAD